MATFADSVVIDRALGTPEGRDLWRLFRRACADESSGLTYDKTSGLIDPLTTSLNAARRDIYTTLRKLATPELLAVAENPQPKEDPKK